MSIADDYPLLVQYERNADNTLGTGAIAFNDDDREVLSIGGIGRVTEEEFYRLNASGLSLRVLSESEAKDLGYREPEAEIPLEERSKAELVDIATSEGVTVSGSASKAKLAEAIKSNRAGVETGPASLPATATPALSGVPGPARDTSGTTSASTGPAGGTA